MSEADDLARRFFVLWAQYLSALAVDPKTTEPLGHWLAFATRTLQAAATEDVGAARSPADAAPAAGPSGDHDAAVADLARRVDELHERLAVLDAAVPAELAGLAAEIARLGPEAVKAALDRQLRCRAEAFLTGLEGYRKHPFRRTEPSAPVRWRRGAARLLDYGQDGTGAAMLIVPSLINRYYILDLIRERSFVRHLAAEGVRPLVLDWGEPGDDEGDLTLADYVTGPLDGAFAAATELAGGPVAICGYCMGGLLALALAQHHPADTAALLLLATPWDFHAEREAQARLLGSLVEWLPRLGGEAGGLPVWAIQSLFLALDPFLAERKFVRFAALDPASEPATSFVALEDWINDGVRLPRSVALECARSWYRENEPARGCWRIAGRTVAPDEVTAPALVVLPSRDRIVPPRSAEPLAAAIAGAAVLRPSLGHIGMMASKAAPNAVWQPIAAWLRNVVG